MIVYLLVSERQISRTLILLSSLGNSPQVKGNEACGVVLNQVIGLEKGEKLFFSRKQEYAVGLYIKVDPLSRRLFRTGNTSKL